MTPCSSREHFPDFDLAMRYRGRAFHIRVRRNIETALGERSWTWLAKEIGIPQSTLASQVGKPRFSLEVVARIAVVLKLDLHELLGLPKRESDSR